MRAARNAPTSPAEVEMKLLAETDALPAEITAQDLGSRAATAGSRAPGDVELLALSRSSAGGTLPSSRARWSAVRAGVRKATPVFRLALLSPIPRLKPSCASERVARDDVSSPCARSCGTLRDLVAVISAAARLASLELLLPYRLYWSTAVIGARCSVSSTLFGGFAILDPASARAARSDPRVLSPQPMSAGPPIIASRRVR
jgi:hypothetical protein